MNCCCSTRPEGRIVVSVSIVSLQGLGIYTLWSCKVWCCRNFEDWQEGAFLKS